MKQHLNQKAILLRKKGLSYSEIIRKVPVTRSTLSLWLRNIKLSEKQTHRFYIKRVKNALMGAKKRNKQRLFISSKIINEAKNEIQQINLDSLRIIGSILYWCEGAKQKDNNVSQGVAFCNSDPKMIRIFLKWLKECLLIKVIDIYFEIYVHESKIDKIDDIIKFWSLETGFDITKFDKIYLKKSKVNTKRKNIGLNYFGLVRVRVKNSTNLNRKVSGWIEGIYNQCGVV